MNFSDQTLEPRRTGHSHGGGNAHRIGRMHSFSPTENHPVPIGSTENYDEPFQTTTTIATLKASRRKRVPFRMCALLMLISLSCLSYLWIFQEAMVLEHLGNIQGAYTRLSTKKKSEEIVLTRFESEVKNGMDDLRVTLEQAVHNLGSESQGIVQILTSLSKAISMSLLSFQDSVETRFKELKEAQETAAKAVSQSRSGSGDWTKVALALEQEIQQQKLVISQMLQEQRTALLAALTEQRNHVEAAGSKEVNRVKQELTGEHRQLAQAILGLRGDLQNLTEQIRAGTKAGSGGFLGGSGGPGGSAAEVATILKEFNETNFAEIHGLRREVGEQLKTLAGHSTKLAKQLAEQTLLSDDASNHIVHAKDPFLWNQHTFQAHAYHHFVQFSGYRKGARSFVAIGLSILNMKNMRKLGDCSWHSLRGVVPGVLRAVYPGEHHNLRYETTILICELAEVALTGGYLVGQLNFEEFVMFREEPSNARLEAGPPFRYNVTTCVAPMHGERFPHIRVKEFVEYHKLLGIHHFVLYDAGAANDEFNALFADDLRGGVVELTPFRNIEKLETWYHGQVLAIQDCLYRSRWSSRWVFMADFDEYFWPQPPMTLATLLKSHEAMAGFTHGSYWFSVHRCRPPGERLLEVRGEAGMKEGQEGEMFAVENFVFRWPQPACFLDGADPQLCHADKGHRKLVLDPRKVEYSGIHGPQEWDTDYPHLEDLRVDVAAHAHFQLLVDTVNGDTFLCNDTISVHDNFDWWKVDTGFARHVWKLRNGYVCKFRESGCVKKGINVAV